MTICRDEKRALLKHWPGARKCSTAELDHMLKQCRTTFEEYFILNGRLSETLIAKQCPFLEKRDIILVRPELDTAVINRQLASAIFNKGFLCHIAKNASDKEKLAKEKAASAILKNQGVQARKDAATAQKSTKLTGLLSKNLAVADIQKLLVGDLRLLAAHYNVLQVHQKANQLKKPELVTLLKEYLVRYIYYKIFMCTFTLILLGEQRTCSSGYNCHRKCASSRSFFARGR